MASNNTLSLLIETRASGSNEISRLENALNRLAESSEKAGKKTEDAGKRAASTARSISDSLRGIGESPLSSATAEVEKYAASLGRLGSIAFGATAGVAALGVGLYDFIKQSASAAQELTNFSSRLGISVGQGAKFSAMARIAGIDIGALESSSRLVAAALEDSRGKGARASRALEALGVSAYTATGQSRELGEVTSEVIEKLAGVGSSAKQAALGNAVLGKGYREIQPLIANYKELREAADQLGIGIDSSGTQKLNEFAKQMNIADLAFSQFRKNLAAGISPLAIPIVMTVTEILNPNSSNKAAQAARGSIIGGALSGIFPGLGAPTTNDATRKILNENPAAPGYLRDPKADPNIAFGREASAVYRKQLADNEDFIKNRLGDLKGGGIGPNGDEFFGTDRLQKLLVSNSVNATDKATFKSQLDAGEAETRELELQLKLIEAKKAAELDIKKIREEVTLKIGHPDGLLPSDLKYIEFASKLGVDDGQKSRFSSAILPLVLQEYDQAVKKAGESGGLGGLRGYLGDTYTPFASKDLAGSNPKTSIETLRAAYETLRKKEDFSKGIIPSLASARGFENASSLNSALAGVNLDAIRSGAAGSEVDVQGRQTAIRKAALQDEYKFQLSLIDDQYAYLDQLGKRDEDAEKQRDAKKLELQKKTALDVSQLETDLATKRAEEFKRLFEQGREFDITRVQNNNLASIQLQGLRLGPNADLDTAARQNAVKKTAVNDEYAYQISLIDKEYAYLGQLAERDEDAEKERKARLLALEKKNELDLSQLKIELAQKIGEEEKKQRDKGRELAGGFFDAAISRQIPQFAKNYALNIGKTIFQNGSQDIFAAAKIQLPGQGTISNPTGLGKLLQGTPFGLDPLKGAMDLSVATINLNTAAIKELTESVTSRVSFADGGTPGGTTSGFPSVFGLGLDPSLGGFAGNDLSSGFSFLGGAQPSAVADIAKLASAVGGASAIKSVGGGIGSLDSIFSKIPALSAGGIQTGPGTATTYAGLASAGVQAGAGVLGLINGLNTGGAKGGLQAVGGAAAIAGSILPLISSKLALAGPIGAAAGAVLGLVSTFLGDPKQNRQKAISKAAQDYQFYTPESFNLSEGTNGGFSDYSRDGNVRSSNISPYPSVSEPYYLFRQNVLVPGQTNSQFGGQNGSQNITIHNHINAIDSQSMAEALAKSHQGVADAFLLSMDRGNTAIADRLRSNING